MSQYQKPPELYDGPWGPVIVAVAGEVPWIIHSEPFHRIIDVPGSMASTQGPSVA